MVILYDKRMTTVIHPGTWLQHPFVPGFCFKVSGTHCIMVVECYVIEYKCFVRYVTIVYIFLETLFITGTMEI